MCLLRDEAGRSVNGFANRLSDGRFELGPNPLGIEDYDRKQENGEHTTDKNDHAQVGAQNAGDREWARGGWHEMVRERHARAQGEGNSHVATALHPGDRARQRVHDHIARITEDGYRDESSDTSHGPRFTALAEELQEALSERLGGAGDFENLADANAKTNHNSDRGECVAEAGRYSGDDVESRLTSHESGHEGRREQSGEGVEPGAKNKDDDRRYSEY